MFGEKQKKSYSSDDDISEISEIEDDVDDIIDDDIEETETETVDDNMSDHSENEETESGKESRAEISFSENQEKISEIVNAAEKTGEFTQEYIVVSPDKRVSSQRMSLFEFTDIISTRATQIEKFADCLVDITGLTSPIDMAKKELFERKSPIIIRRKMGRKKCADGLTREIYEYWRANEMEFPVINFKPEI